MVRPEARWDSWTALCVQENVKQSTGRAAHITEDFFWALLAH